MDLTIEIIKNILEDGSQWNKDDQTLIYKFANGKISFLNNKNRVAGIQSYENLGSYILFENEDEINLEFSGIKYTIKSIDEDELVVVSKGQELIFFGQYF